MYDKQEPKISIIIPTYNRAGLLIQAVESALDQDYEHLEVIVSDNASTDDTSEVIKRYEGDARFRYCRNLENIGMVGNWRKALFDYATGDWFVILSDDDYLTDRSYFSKAADLIRSNLDIVIVYANGYILNEKTATMSSLNLPFATVEEGKRVFLSRGLVKPQDFTLCNVLFYREQALRLNPFSNEHNMSCDSELFLKMCLHGKVGTIKDYVSVYRFHAGNIITKFLKDIDLLVGSLDYPLESYRLARELNAFSEQELEDYKKRIVVDSLNSVLVCLVTSHGKSYEEAIAIVENKLASCYQELTKDIFGANKVRLIKTKHAFMGLVRVIKGLILSKQRC